MKKRIAALLALALVFALLAAPAAHAAYADGTYTVPVSIEGLGRHNVLWSAATLHVEGGSLYIDVTFERVDPATHAPQYDWMQTSLGRVTPVKNDDTCLCTFYRLPIPNLGNVPVTVLSSAMSQPYEIEYTLVIDGSSVPLAEGPASEPEPSAEPTPDSAETPAPTEAPPSTAEPTDEPTDAPPATAKPTAEPTAEPTPEQPAETPIPTPEQPIEPTVPDEPSAPADGSDAPAPSDAVILTPDMPTDAPDYAPDAEPEHPGTPEAPSAPTPAPAEHNGLGTGGVIGIVAAAVVVAAVVLALVLKKKK